jgi:hypothetical protein
VWPYLTFAGLFLTTYGLVGKIWPWIERWLEED